MLQRLGLRIYFAIAMALALSGCSAIRGIGDALINSFKGFSLPIPTIHFR